MPDEVVIYDGVCDSTKEIKKLLGKMPNDDKWFIASSGHSMFVSFTVSVLTSGPGFQAKITYGKICQRF